MYCFGFFLKKLISAFLMPLPFVILLILIGLIFLWFTKKQTTGKVLVTIGSILLMLLGMTISLSLINQPLDQAYEIYKPGKNNQIKFVVILSGGAYFKDGIPMNTSGDYVTLSRLMEGVRVYKSNPGSKIVLTGGPVCGIIPFSVIEASLLMQLGIPKDDLILDIQSFDTSEEALNTKKIVKNERFVLVTSANHMTRALKLFQRQGMFPIPAPTDFKCVSSLSIFDFIPNPRNISLLNTTIHEYIGIFYSKLCGIL